MANGCIAKENPIGTPDVPKDIAGRSNRGYIMEAISTTNTAKAVGIKSDLETTTGTVLTHHMMGRFLKAHMAIAKIARTMGGSLSMVDLDTSQLREHSLNSQRC